MLRYRSDLRSCMIALIIPLTSLFHWMVGFSLLVFFLQLLLSTLTVVVVHNHTHISFFTSKRFNRFLDYWLSICQACPVSFFLPFHQGNHHAFTGQDQDVSKVRGNESYCFLGFCLHPFKVLPHLWRFIRDHRNLLQKKLARRIKVELIILISIEIILFSLDPIKFLYAVLIPQAMAFHIMLASNFLQHAGLSNSVFMNSSRNFTGKIFNLIYQNVGYHTAHHHKPSLHWSQLPICHQEIENQIPKSCVEPNFSLYMFFLICNAMKG